MCASRTTPITSNGAPPVSALTIRRPTASLSRPELSRRAFADESHPPLARRFFLAKTAPAEHRNVDGVEEVRVDVVHRDDRRIGLRRGAAVEGEHAARAPARGQRGPASPARRFDAGQGDDVVDDLPIERAGLLPVVPLREGIDRQHQEIVGSETDVDRAGVPAALHEETGADQQQHGNGNLEHDEPVRQAPPRDGPTGVTATRADRARELDPRRAQRRHKSGQHAGRHRRC